MEKFQNRKKDVYHIVIHIRVHFCSANFQVQYHIQSSSCSLDDNSSGITKFLSSIKWNNNRHSLTLLFTLFQKHSSAADDKKGFPCFHLVELVSFPWFNCSNDTYYQSKIRISSTNFRSVSATYEGKTIQECLVLCSSLQRKCCEK